MSELHERLREIARLQRREYVDGTVLTGFGPNDPPPPTHRRRRNRGGWLRLRFGTRSGVSNQRF